MKLNRLFRWGEEIYHWLAEGKVAFMCIVIPFAALCLCLGVWRNEKSIRTAGYILQILGMIFTIRGLLRLRTYFGQLPLHELFFNWLKRFPKWERNVVLSVCTANLVGAGLKAHAEVWTPDKPELTCEQRIELVFRNLNRIRNDLLEHTKSIENFKDIQGRHEKNVGEEINKFVNKFRSDLEYLHTSDLLLSLVGLVWLTIGISMSTMAPELAKWLK